MDLAPPGGFETEERAISSPTPFPVRPYVLEDLFAGKIHAALFRPWKNRVKGRDWFDVLWYLSKGVALNLNHVKTRAIDSGDLDPEALWNAEVFMEFLRRKIESLNWEQAKADVAPFLEDPSCLEGWSSSLFLQMIEKIRYC